MHLKKGKFKFQAIETIRSSKLYCVDKPELRHFVEKYHTHDGDPLLFYNTPIYLSAKEYVDNGKNFIDNFAQSPFVLSSMERYQCFTVQYQQELAIRIISIVDSIRKHGYAKGKYKKRLIGVLKVGKVYQLISGKHRAAACLALGLKKVRVNVYVSALSA